MQGGYVHYHRVSSVRLFSHWKWHFGVVEVTLFALSIQDWYIRTRSVFVTMDDPAWPSAMAGLRCSMLTFSQVFYMYGV